MLNKQNLFGKRDDGVLTRDPRLPGYGPVSSGISSNTPPQATASTAAPQPTTGTSEEEAKVEKTSEVNSENRLIVGPEVKLKGAEILDCDTLVVEGRVEATMDSRVINIAENGSFAGKVMIDVAEIHGRFDGELTARSQLIIHATGRVCGTIRYGKITIEEGGELSGDVRSMTADDTAPVLTHRATAFDFTKAKPVVAATNS